MPLMFMGGLVVGVLAGGSIWAAVDNLTDPATTTVNGISPLQLALIGGAGYLAYKYIK